MLTWNPCDNCRFVRIVHYCIDSLIACHCWYESALVPCSSCRFVGLVRIVHRNAERGFLVEECRSLRLQVNSPIGWFASTEVRWPTTSHTSTRLIQCYFEVKTFDVIRRRKLRTEGFIKEKMHNRPEKPITNEFDFALSATIHNSLPVHFGSPCATLLTLGCRGCIHCPS